MRAASPAMTFAEWQSLAPREAARQIHRRLAALPPALRHAALAFLNREEVLAEILAAAPASAPLRAIPYFLKDLFDLAGVPTSAGSTFLPEARPTPKQDSAIVQRLRALGAVVAGKTHLVEFASGLTGENPHYGDCPHPRFPDRLAGGSSSGSAALVAAGVAPLALGTDTGGSVRVPAAFCGLYGFRLTPGDELIRDALPLAPTMDTAGWFTATAADMRATLDALLPSLRSSRRTEAEMVRTVAEPVRVWPLCWPAEHAFGYDSPSAPPPRGCYLPLLALLDHADAETARACESASAALCPPADAATRGALLAAWSDAVDAYLTIGMSEAHAVHRDWLQPYRERYDPAVWQRFTDAGRYPAEQVARARATLQRVREGWRQFFRSYDFLVLPASPTPAPRKADCTPEFRRRILTLTAPASLGGLPILTIPAPLASGLTTGLQIIAARPDSSVFAWALTNSQGNRLA